MKKHFYQHLIQIDPIYEELIKLDLEKYEQDELITIVHVQIHHVVVDTVLTELSEENKKIFLRHLHADAHDKIWEHINKYIEHADNKIILAVEKLLSELQKDINEARKKYA